MHAGAEGDPGRGGLLVFGARRGDEPRELGRGVYLGYQRGAYFREGWLLLLMRVLAVALPGLPFHRVQDYVNAMVLGGYIPKDN
jgi:hypothetical protein